VRPWAQSSVVVRPEQAVAWVATRRELGGKDAEPLICSTQPRRLGEPLGRHVLLKRFRTARRDLGADHLMDLTIHHGRHTFISRALGAVEWV